MKIYVYDNTFEGLLTAIYEAFYEKNPLAAFYAQNELDAPLLLGENITILTNHEKFKKVKNAIINKLDFLAFKKLYMVFLSNEKEKGVIIYKYLKTAFKLGPEVHNFLNINEIRIVDNISKQISYETHRFEGFIRFNYIDEKFLYSSIEPDNDILELLGDHFQNRFPKEYFIIHDILRDKALIYNTFFYEIIEMTNDTYEKLKSHSDDYTKLWKAYFKSTTIEERKNLRLQSRMMPKRYWKHILET
ncbi:putative DNA metabolism protein [Clostridium saccharoperbutylacetonicum]|uniref:Putative DNA metabolism protein n=1 Tax=Clostridium saccharoperbutylacetonicum N1-4(HMT) TaxID=931276 RepID=M1MQE9_9CLOT|nr:TIGR03915 family putative DNA repair protein [Clostridium saccharoperbutylacetonicum]AGF58413.1 putative DNA metabolism protein [Clostridium saccharoperbutylacetonicum N1-4(HMT)]NRT60809.1 putative DNA metabolism protein [Clostridium saccharoperbutylacetonicum]NSB24123.1 putative DNA metabolism protein [Clostridium saccharoperbutylacetonicum]NSB43501.1 putative DNA metabolism protein [Clostridium saccharoperbutylacetonicum]